MNSPGERPRVGPVDRRLGADRDYVLALGGFSLELAGASLVTHERIPVPTFNYIVVRGVGRERQAAFFERALDHYFQRALRPMVLLPPSAPPHIREGFERFGFRPAPARLGIYELARPVATGRSADPPTEVREVGSGEIERVLSFWAAPPEREEFARSLRALLDHPNPSERLRLYAATDGPEIVAVGALYTLEGSGTLHGVATRPGRRREGAAGAIVGAAIAATESSPTVSLGLITPEGEWTEGLRALGFERAGELERWELPATADLHLAPPGPPTPPRWRPPRAESSSARREP